MFIHPFREVFVNFPNQRLGSGVRLTVFLPEEKIPLSKSYPLVVFIGFSRNEVELGESLARKQEIILAVVSWEDWAGKAVTQPDELSQFIHRELMPYLETNYPVLYGARFRTLVVRGEEGTDAILPLLKHPDWVGNWVFLEPHTFKLPQERSLDNIRFYVRGDQAQLAAVQAELEQAGLTYGPDFAMSYTDPAHNGLQAVDFTYLSAPKEQLALKRLDAFTQKDVLLLQVGEKTGLRVGAQLKNKYWFTYIPQQVRFSPPYLTWDAAQGTLKVVPGAQQGTVKIRSGVDKPKFSTKIKLKTL